MSADEPRQLEGSSLPIDAKVLAIVVMAIVVMAIGAMGIVPLATGGSWRGRSPAQVLTLGRALVFVSFGLGGLGLLRRGDWARKLLLVAFCVGYVTDLADTPSYLRSHAAAIDELRWSHLWRAAVANGLWTAFVVCYLCSPAVRRAVAAGSTAAQEPTAPGNGGTVASTKRGLPPPMKVLAFGVLAGVAAVVLHVLGHAKLEHAAIDTSENG